MKKTKKVFIFFVIAFALLCGFLPEAYAAPDPGIQAESALLVESGTGRVLYEKSKDKMVDGENLTKIMTLLLAVEAYEENIVSLDDSVIMTNDAWSDVTSGSANVNIRSGEAIIFEDLLYCAQVASANEASNMIAIHVAGSLEAFVDMMNDRARELGCQNTHFTNAHGLTNNGQYTTAWDTYLILSEAMTHPLFVELFGATTHTVPKTNISGKRILNTTNLLMQPDGGYYYEYCTGGKAGGTQNHGYGIAANAQKDDISLTSVVIGANVASGGSETADQSAFAYAKTLFEWGFSNFSWRTIISPDSSVRLVDIKMGYGANHVMVKPVSGITVLLDNSVPLSDFNKKITIYSERDGTELMAPVAAGDILGEMTVYLHGENYGTVKLESTSSVALFRSAYFKSEIKEALGLSGVRWTIAGITALFIAYFSYIISLKAKRRRRKNEIREIQKRLIDEHKSGTRQIGGCSDQEKFEINAEFEPQEEFAPDKSFEKFFSEK